MMSNLIEIAADFSKITNVNDKFLNGLEKKLYFKQDKRIKFVGIVYDQELLKKIRDNAYVEINNTFVRIQKEAKAFYKFLRKFFWATLTGIVFSAIVGM